MKISAAFVMSAAFACCASGLFPSAFAAAPAEPPTLERVVVVMRHGVRAPNDTSQALSAYARDPWYRWSVAPGVLTRHGADGAMAMGAKLQAFYAHAGLLPSRACAGRSRVFVWADSEDSRTRQSGTAVARGLTGGCMRSAQFLAPAGRRDPLFSHEGNKACRLNPDKARDALMTSVPDLNHLGPEYDKARRTLVHILWPGLTEEDCQRPDAPKACLFLTGKNRFQPDDWKIQLRGPLKTGSTLSENLLLEYAERHPKTAVGWGRAGSAEVITDIMPMHNIYTRLTRQNPYYAGHRAAVLVREITDLLSAPSGAFRGAVPVPEAAKLVLFLGHDSNLSNLAGVFQLDWKLADQPDDTAPNTALSFERWREPDGRTVIKVRIFWQSLKEQRASGTAARGHAQLLQIPDCDTDKNGQCTVKKFAGFALSRIYPSCFAQ